MKPQRPRRLFHRIYLHGVVLLLMVTVSLALAGFFLGRDWRWHRHPQRLAAHLGGLLSSVPEPALDETVARFSRELDVNLAVYSDDGTRLAGAGERPPPPRPARIARPRGSPVRDERTHRVVSAPAGPGRYLRLSFLQQEADMLLRALGFLAVIVLVLALASAPLARAIARPIERLSQTARRLGQGDLSARSGVVRRDEIGALARAFDEMAERLERLVEGQRELVANVSHELRTPLARMRVSLGLAAEAEPGEARELLRDMDADIAELERLVADLLTTARLDATGSLALRRERLDPRGLADAALARFRRLHPHRSAAAELADAPPVDADPELLARVLDNLLDNAAKYSEAPSPIGLALDAAGGGVRFAVRDQGVGIAAEDQPRVFTPFFRADPSRARGTGGVGLGLALSKRIVDAHGGRITLASEPGRGTTVTVWLPAAP
jgi:signal transduction histidine kinase